MNKKRILFCGEFTNLNTGYSVYQREVMLAMAKTGRYELAEHASYCGVYDKTPAGKVLNQAALTLPWKVYPNSATPDNKEENNEFHSDPTNVFGKWRFDRVCLDFHPDIVCTLRDGWMDSHVGSSLLRPYYNWLTLAPVDSEPQRGNWYHENWLNADGVLTFTEWGKSVLDHDGGGLVNTVGAAPICANSLFRPVKDKAAHKDKWRLTQDSIIIGTVMRNQKRKLFPELLEAFAQLVKNSPKNVADNLHLFLYTAYPDLGWDLPLLINDFGLSNKVIVCYMCRDCKHTFISPFKDARTNCTKCGKYVATMPSVSIGLTTEQLVEIYNLFDIYVQYAICEGFGGPTMEAAACGVPVIGVDYSATTEVVKNCRGYLVPPATLYREPETMAYRAYPDNDKLVEILAKLTQQPRSMLEKQGKRAREGVEKYYADWGKTAQVWMDYIDNVELKNKQGKWDSSPRFIQPANSGPDCKTHNDFITWAIINILQEPELLYSKKHIDWVCQLGLDSKILTGVNAGQAAIPVSREILLKGFLSRVQRKNEIEQARVSKLNSEDFIQFANMRK